MNIREQINRDVSKAIQELSIDDRRLTIDWNIEVTRTSDPKNGDYSTNIAMKLAKETKQSPTEFANILADNLKKQSYIEKVEVAGPGFVNIFVKANVWQSEVQKVLSDIERYGANSVGKGKKARVEFVSANPTGPLHFGNARGGPIGDTLASVLEFSGYKVLREYIHNDVGEQVRKLGETIANVAKGQSLEDQEYKGEYILDLVKEFRISNFKFQIPSEVGKWATSKMLDETLADCEAIGIKFDKVYPESGFIESGDTERAIAELDKKGVVKEKDGAEWFAPSDEFLKDRETVVVKSDGNYTYFSNDIAYHKIKFSEGYDLVVDVFGANHHGHVPRLQAVIKAFGGDVSKFHVILYQWVRFKKGGQVVAMSKRAGTFITVREILDEVGPDVVRFFILMHDPNTHIDFDLDLAKEKSSKNPVFYVQYAHARISSIMAKEEASIDRTTIDYSLLTTDFELGLIKKISKLPELVEDIAGNFAVNALTTYAVELADSFHKFYENCKVLDSKNEEMMRARLALLGATRITLANTLRLLGISAPEKM